jgi:hypothetical protein
MLLKFRYDPNREYPPLTIFSLSARAGLRLGFDYQCPSEVGRRRSCSAPDEVARSGVVLALSRIPDDRSMSAFGGKADIVVDSNIPVAATNVCFWG